MWLELAQKPDIFSVCKASSIILSFFETPLHANENKLYFALNCAISKTLRLNNTFLFVLNLTDMQVLGRQSSTLFSLWPWVSLKTTVRKQTLEIWILLRCTRVTRTRCKGIDPRVKNFWVASLAKMIILLWFYCRFWRFLPSNKKHDSPVWQRRFLPSNKKFCSRNFLLPFWKKEKRGCVFFYIGVFSGVFLNFGIFSCPFNWYSLYLINYNRQNTHKTIIRLD